MKCRNCGTDVLGNVQTCPQCGESVTQLTGKQYRSRFALFFRTWVGATGGWHLKWLGYPNEAKEVKREVGIGLSSVFNPWKLISSMIYQVSECFGVIFGKYRTDANGLPVRYFKPKNRK